MLPANSVKRTDATKNLASEQHRQLCHDPTDVLWKRARRARISLLESQLVEAWMPIVLLLGVLTRLLGLKENHSRPCRTWLDGPHHVPYTTSNVSNTKIIKEPLKSGSRWL